MNIQRHILALALMAAAALPQGLAAQKAAPFDPTTATIEENIRYPEVPAKQSAAERRDLQRRQGFLRLV